MSRTGEATIRLTQRPELERLMANEFHANGSAAFERTLPNRFISRLHAQQKQLLAKAVPNGSLAAFVTLGDGEFDRFMAADFLDDKLKRTSKKPPIPGSVQKLRVMDDNVRPNASLALFARDAADEIHLVFYTRYFVVSYRPSLEARRLCRILDVEADAARRADLKKQIYNAMCRMDCVTGRKNVPGFFAVDRPDSRNKYRLLINSVKIERVDDRAENYSRGVYSYVPYIVLEWWDASNSNWVIPAWMRPSGQGKFSTIHGTVNTLGCWMLLRNFVWNWPNENSGNSFEHLSYCLSALRAGDSRYQHCANAYLTPIAGMDADRAFRAGYKNFTYYEFVKTFAGIHYNCQKNYITARPQRPLRITAAPKSSPNSTTRFRTSLIDTTDDLWKGESIWFVGGALDGQKRIITAYKGTTKEITVSSPLPSVPQAGATFVMDNAWTPSPNPTWGPNIFGTGKNRPGFGRAWADAYLFKRSFKSGEVPFRP